MSRFVVLMYHMITEPGTKAESRYACPPKRFEQHMKFLHDNHYNVISLNDIESILKNKTKIPEKSVAVTLDDGFEDNYSNAYPTLNKYQIPATIFLTSGNMGGTNQWMSGKDYPKRPMMNWSQIQEMDNNGIYFGGHTVNHVKLSQIDSQTAGNEIKRDKNQIEDKLGHEIAYFAYPYGLFNNATANLTKAAGYTLACSTRSGFNNHKADPFIIRRLEVYGTDTIRALKQKIAFGVNDSEISYPIKYYWNRLKGKVL